jgi:hypothetical protein
VTLAGVFWRLLLFVSNSFRKAYKTAITHNIFETTITTIETINSIFKQLCHILLYCLSIILKLEWMLDQLKSYRLLNSSFSFKICSLKFPPLSILIQVSHD